MNDRRWSWAVTLAGCAYVLWIAYALSTRTSGFGQLLTGLGNELPATTAFALSACREPIPIIAALVLVVLLIVKELRLKSLVARLSMTVLTVIAVSWFADFVLQALYRPLFDVLDQIG